MIAIAVDKDELLVVKIARYFNKRLDFSPIIAINSCTRINA